MLSISRPDIVADAHRQYLEAGADILKTNSFTATSIAQSDYDLADRAAEMNLAAARIARPARTNSPRRHGHAMSPA